MNNTTDRLAIEDMLPFYVNGSLDKHELKQVEEALINNKDLQEELVFLKQLRVQVKQQSENSPGELGLKRLQKQLKTNQSKNKHNHKTNNAEQKLNRWRIIALAACLVLLVQVASKIKPVEDDVFKAASGQLATQSNGTLVSVTFAPDATELKIRKLLLETNISIIKGPSALGIYQLSIADNVELTINLLKSRIDLIESIQQE